MNNTELIRRLCHSAGSVMISTKCTEVILFGGQYRIAGRKMADTSALRFGNLIKGKLAEWEGIC